MLVFEDVKKAYLGETILDNISFKLNKGDKCGLVGRNGSGKTTLLRMITGEESQDSGVIEIPKSYSLGYLTQHLHFTEKTLIEEAALVLSEGEKDHLYKAEKILFGLGFSEENLKMSPKDFSGGYQLRIHLAKLLLKEPDCLLLDEPTNYLDIVAVRWLTRFLKNWKGEFILISHDREFMDSVTNHTLGIHRQKIRKFEGGTVKFYEQLLHEEHVHERTRINLEKKKAHMQSFITRLGAKASKASQAQSRAKALARMPALEELAAIYHLDFDFPFSPFPGIQLLETHQLCFQYPKCQEPLIQNVNLSISKGERIAIIGKNGRGKSTLLRLLAQDLEPGSGHIKMASNVKIGYFGQTNIDRLDAQKTVEEEIASATPYLTTSEVRRLCGVMMFSGDKAQKKIEVLSGGEKSRVLLGKILATPCNLLLLDEPTNHLDMESIEALVSALDHFEGAVVIVTHSEMILRQIPQKFVICHLGNQHLFNGDYEEFLIQEGWESHESVEPKKESKKEIVRPKSKNAHLLQKKADQIEKEIMDIEFEMEKHIHELVEITKKGDRDAITRLSQAIDEKKKKVDQLFTQLEALSLDLEETKKRFQK